MIGTNQNEPWAIIRNFSHCSKAKRQYTVTNRYWNQYDLISKAFKIFIEKKVNAAQASNVFKC